MSPIRELELYLVLPEIYPIILYRNLFQYLILVWAYFSHI